MLPFAVQGWPLGCAEDPTRAAWCYRLRKLEPSSAPGSVSEARLAQEDPARTWYFSI